MSPINQEKTVDVKIKKRKTFNIKDVLMSRIDATESKVNSKSEPYAANFNRAMVNNFDL